MVPCHASHKHRCLLDPAKLGWICPSETDDLLDKVTLSDYRSGKINGERFGMSVTVEDASKPKEYMYKNVAKSVRYIVEIRPTVWALHAGKSS